MTHLTLTGQQHDLVRRTPRGLIAGSRVSDAPDNARDDFEIVVANGDRSLLVAADALVTRQYAGKGLSVGSYTRDAREDNSVTVVAIRDGRVVATMTARNDGPGGLLAENLYEREISHSRLAGGRLCELTRLATDPRFNSQVLLATLFNATYRVARSRFGTTDFFMEVHPRHAPYYTRMVGCQIVGGETTCPRVNAPAVLLHLPARRVEDRMIATAACRTVGRSTRRSVYGYLQHASGDRSRAGQWTPAFA